jgi:hypothetical protein
MKSTPAQRRLVVVLFVLVLITFSFAQRDSKRLEQVYTSVVEKTGNVAVVKNAPAPATPVK